MKKMICMLLTVLLFGMTAWAEAPEQWLTDVLQESGYEAELRGLTQTGGVHLAVHLPQEESCMLHIFTDPTQGKARLVVYDVHLYAMEAETPLLRVLNEINSAYMFTRFYAMDGSVMCEMNLFLPEGDGAGPMVLAAIELVSGMLEEARPLLQ